MRLGIDLDNTILEYLPLYHKLGCAHGWLDTSCRLEKAEIKSALAKVAGSAQQGELRWQRLQAMVYGEKIDEATIFPGFAGFVASAHRMGWQLFIVSHKSRYSHLDPNVDLHYWARTTLTRRGFFRPLAEGGMGFKNEEVFFCPTRDEKIAAITDLKLDGFIDDLASVLRHDLWPADTRGMLIHGDHPSLLSAADWYTAEAIYACVAAGLAFPERAQPLTGGGNNRLTGLRIAGQEWVYKAFHDTSPQGQIRPDAEWRFLSVLEQQRLPAPRPGARTAQGLFMTRVFGQTPEPGNRAKQLVAFLIELDKLGRELEPSRLLPAAHARLRPGLFVTHLEERIAALDQACRHQTAPVYQEVLAFLRGNFASQHQRARHHFEEVCGQRHIDPKVALARPLHFASPSDFGPHNCLEQADGSLIFLDFEYAGWDDPAKLLCDILYHVGSGLSEDERHEIVATFIDYRREDPGLRHRVEACADLVRLEWMAIVLNVVRPAELARKCFAGADPEKLLRQRLERAHGLARASSLNPIGEGFDIYSTNP